jgi:hypothetical protein
MRVLAQLQETDGRLRDLREGLMALLGRTSPQGNELGGLPMRPGSPGPTVLRRTIIRIHFPKEQGEP